MKHGQLYITFPTTADAIHFERAAKADQVSGKLVSAPRELTSGCGFAWRSHSEDKDKIQALLANNQIDFDEIADLQN